MKRGPFIFLLATVVCFLYACKNKPLPNQEMANLLQVTARNEINADNIFSPEAVVTFADSLIDASPQRIDRVSVLLRKAGALIQLGLEQKAIDLLQQVL